MNVLKSIKKKQNQNNRWLKVFSPLGKKPLKKRQNQHIISFKETYFVVINKVQEVFAKKNLNLKVTLINFFSNYFVTK